MDDLQMQRMERRDGALFRKVGDVIAAEPERYYQGWFARTNECGTVACIAGHALLLTYDFGGVSPVKWMGTPGNPVFEAAGAALGLTNAEYDLFFGEWHPAGDPATPLHVRVRDALYALADGAAVEEVTA